MVTRQTVYDDFTIAIPYEDKVIFIHLQDCLEIITSDAIIFVVNSN